MAQHFMLKAKRQGGQAPDLGRFISDASAFLPITAVQKEAGHAFATGGGSFLLVFLSKNEFILEAYSENPISFDGLGNLAIQRFSLRPEQVRIIDLNSGAPAPRECEEPNCTRPAVKEYNGRKVCSDHYDFYKEKEFQAFTHHEY